MTTETKFTPGPWKIRDWFYEPGDGLVMDRDICATNDKVIATAYETPADAALMAAAPCLYEALAEAVRTIRAFHDMGMPKESRASLWGIYQQSPEMLKINAALKKARGES